MKITQRANLDKAPTAAIEPPVASVLGAWFTLGLLTFIGILAAIDRQLPFVLAQPIKEELNLSDGQLGLIGGAAFSVFYTALVLPLANLADQTSRKWVITIGVGLWSLLTMVMGAVSSFMQMFAARAGVAVGEAGCNAPSHSLISDSFPPGQRATALAIYAIAGTAGAMIAFGLGGWMATQYGWRFVFVAFGLLGIVTSIVAAVSLPNRQAIANRASDASLLVRVRVILSHPALRILIAAACLLGFIAQGVMAWLAPMIMRVYGISTAQAGLIIGLPIGLAGSLGILFGGIVSDRLGETNAHPSLKIPAVALLISTPILVFAVLSSSIKLFVIASCVGMFFSAMPLGPTFATIQHIAHPTQRATTTATVILITNLLGGLGPAVVGFLSDALASHFREDALRVAVVAVLLLYPVSAWLYLKVSDALNKKTH